MASPISLSFIISPFVIVTLFLLTCSSKATYASGVSETYHHTIRPSTLLKPSICRPFTKGQSKGESSLKLVDQHGPCYQPASKDKAKAPTITQILSRDQSRVNSIQSRLSSSRSNASLKDSKTTLPTKSDTSLGTGPYIVTVGLGTPKKSLSLAFDTGSDLTWTQCQPCAGSCYEQKEPIFNPSLSKTYKNFTCDSTQCSQAGSSINDQGCIDNTCAYGIRYGDGSFSQGFFARETLTLIKTEVFPNFQFGCGQNNKGLFGATAGLLGLGRQQVSFISQTAKKYGKYFSYCIPSPSSSSGHLTFGKGGNKTISLKFTPFATNPRHPSFYFIDMIAIKVAGKTLPISQSVFNTAGTIIDSGTTITWLPPAAYSVLRRAFRQEMKEYPRTRGLEVLDTCYDFSDFTEVTIPKISFYFNGNIEVPIALSGVVDGESVSQICLVFAANSDTSDVGIFGSMQQRTLEVVHDIAGGKLGFGTKGCS